MKPHILKALLLGVAIALCLGAATNWVAGNKITATWLNYLYGTNGHKHDGADADGHAPKVDLRDHVTNDVHASNHPNVLTNARSGFPQPFSNAEFCDPDNANGRKALQLLDLQACANDIPSATWQVFGPTITQDYDELNSFILSQRGATVAPSLRWEATLVSNEPATAGLRVCCQNGDNGQYDGGDCIENEDVGVVGVGGVNAKRVQSPCTQFSDSGYVQRKCRWETKRTSLDGGVMPADASGAGMGMIEYNVHECGDAGW